MPSEKYIWIALPEKLWRITGAVFYLYQTRTKGFQFGDKVYINEDGYAQKRKHGKPLGWFVKTGKSLDPELADELTERLKKILIKDTLNEDGNLYIPSH